RARGDSQRRQQGPDPRGADPRRRVLRHPSGRRRLPERDRGTRRTRGSVMGGGTRDGLVGPVGLVGLGMMGWPMARNLVTAGYEVVVRDADPERQERFVAEHGGVAADSPAAFGDTGVVVTMLPDDKVVRDVVLSWEGG